MNDLSSSYDGKWLSEDKNPLSNPDVLPYEEQEAETHPSPEMLLIRIAIEKALMNDQRKLWYMHAYDKMRDAEIARKLKISKQAVGQRIKVIEKKIKLYCKEHWEVYKTLKEAQYDTSYEDIGC